MNGEYSWAQHDGLEVAPTDQYPIATTPGAPAQVVPTPHYAPQPVLPSNRPENAPEPFVPEARPEYFVRRQDVHEISGNQHWKAADTSVTEIQTNESRRHASKRVLIIGIIVVLVVIITGMGTGLGYTLGRKHNSAGTV
jgi:hypothetical protein